VQAPVAPPVIGRGIRGGKSGPDERLGRPAARDLPDRPGHGPVADPFYGRRGRDTGVREQLREKGGQRRLHRRELLGEQEQRRRPVPREARFEGEDRTREALERGETLSAVFARYGIL